MRNNDVVLTLEEKLYLYKYFRSINALLSRRMLPGRKPNEEHLTSTLCELLDERYEALHNLDYTWSMLINDFNKENILNAFSLEIQTNEHYKKFEGKYSYADLGIVVNYHNSFTGFTSTRAILFQAKKLFPNNNQYNLSSRYESFDIEQLNNLFSIGAIYDKKKCGYGDAPSSEYLFYLFYDPLQNNFSKTSHQKLLYLNEIRGHHRISHRHNKHMEGYDLMLPYFQKIQWKLYFNEELEYLPQIGMVVLSAHDLWCRIMTKKSYGDDRPISCFSIDDKRDDFKIRKSYERYKPRFEDIYCNMEEWPYLNAIQFEDFMVFHLLTSYLGSQNEGIIKIASGEPPDTKRNWATKYSIKIDIESRHDDLNVHSIKK